MNKYNICICERPLGSFQICRRCLLRKCQ